MSMSNKKSLLFTSIVLVQVILCASMTIRHGSDSDPAPGRSPGPPRLTESSLEQLEDSITEYNSVTSSRSSEYSYEDTDDNRTELCAGERLDGSHIVFLNISHHIFNISYGLVPGVSYEVEILQRNSNVQIEEAIVSSILTTNQQPIGIWKNSIIRQWCSDVVGSVGRKFEWVIPDVNFVSVNITFRVLFKVRQQLYEIMRTLHTRSDCQLWLWPSFANLTSHDIPANIARCKINFPVTSNGNKESEGLLTEVTRLNIPCSQGNIQFNTQDNKIEDNHISFTMPKKLCGKLEELNLNERKIYIPLISNNNMPFLIINKQAIFSLKYRLVDFCYNLTLTQRTGHFILNPNTNIYCTFTIHLPYGYRVLLRLQMGEDLDLNAQNNSGNFNISEINKRTKKHAHFDVKEQDDCGGMLVKVWDGVSMWQHCNKDGDPKRDIQVWSQENVVIIKIIAQNEDLLKLTNIKFWYHAEPVSEVVGHCEFGEVLVKQFCVRVVYKELKWSEAEEFCAKNGGGHLVSIRDDQSQTVVNNIIMRSYGYSDANSYWVGASDKTYEGHYRWTDGYTFSYTNWFPGWPQNGYANKQPNDDGFSDQDCVELRRSFQLPVSSARPTEALTSSFVWNDRDCQTNNYFLCERLQNGESSEEGWKQDCNKTFTLSRDQPRATVVSPGFPHQYPDNAECVTVVTAPHGFRLLLDFEELVLEKEPYCSYDYLEIKETLENETIISKRLCGDWSEKLKLLRYTSKTPQVTLKFVSDYSHHFGGLKAKVYIEDVAMECADERHEMFNNSCYMFVSYPKVTWQTAQQICAGMKAELASVQSGEEENFITSNIRKSPEYSTMAIYWIGGHIGPTDEWAWIDGSLLSYTAWLPNDALDNTLLGGPQPSCLGIQWVSSRSDHGLPTSGLYWKPEQCKRIGGYVCKKENQISGISLNLNRTINGSEGHITSPNYPGTYYHHLDYSIHLIGPTWTRLVVTITKMDLETQSECLYDFIELKSGGAEVPEVRWCGNHQNKADSFNFVSNNNEAILRFHSDYSISGTGFAGSWKAVDITGCPLQTLTAKEGILSTPNYPEFLLPRLDCATIILSPAGKRVWLEFKDIDMISSAAVELDLGDGVPTIQPFQAEDTISDGVFLSTAEKMFVRLKSGDDPRGGGFRALYQTVTVVHEERVIELNSDSVGVLHHINYPAPPPPHVDFVQHLVAPLGYIVAVEFHHVQFMEDGVECPGGRGVIEVFDNYADTNGTWWFLCELEKLFSTRPVPSLGITSYLNTIHIRQRSLTIGVSLNATVKVKIDPTYKLKILRAPEDGVVESCRPNPCLNGGKCLNFNGRKSCQCVSHFTGMFCALTICELEPCLFGQCELTANGHICRCQHGYTGVSCEIKQKPCADNPCEGRGECIIKSNTFHCRCYAWWEGPRCERKLMNIPYKPLSERMFQEPFWLGLITVFIVLAVIGLVWCAKRHFPEKLEKLLAEEADRSGRTNMCGTVRPPSVREQVTASHTATVTVPSPQVHKDPRSLFGRLGIRKPSLLSLSSPQLPDCASRTFSLDDLLRPPTRRTPSPRKKRTNSTPNKKNAAEKKQILQQLVAPSSNLPNQNKKMNLCELIQMKEKSASADNDNIHHDGSIKETSFSLPSTSSESKIDKLEKKVTFARLLSKVSAEMSSGSLESENKPVLVRAASNPGSPVSATKSPHSTSSNQGSDSLSSSDIAINGSALDIPGHNKRPNKLLSSRPLKNPSADSILAMFRNFSSTQASLGSKVSTTTTTPTGSSPQDEVAGSDESSASSPIQTPVSTSSGQLESPTRYTSTTIEVPVMDALTAQKSCANSSGSFLQPPTILLEVPSPGNKCLSPIREVPTPIPSPALSPVLPRCDYRQQAVDIESEDDTFTKQEDEDSEIMEDPHDEEEVMPLGDCVSSPVKKHRPPPLIAPTLSVTDWEDGLHSITIPLLTIQEPSPTRTTPPFVICPGSPPPHRSEPFSFRAPKSPPKRLLKELDKPNSLDLPHPPPMITITCNMSEAESDMETSPATKMSLRPPSDNPGMCYLSPFSMCSRADRTASESNLSSSGYSSMASPGPSRCGSNNPLCLSEVEDGHHQSHSQPPSRRPSPVLRTPTMSEPRIESEQVRMRVRSDSETLSDDPLVESNDEGIGTDHIDEKIEEGDLKSARDVEVFIGNGLEGLAVFIPTQRIKKEETIKISPPKSCLQLPAIIVQSDSGDKLLSPVSSRSESPLSDKALGVNRFSPMFYCKNKSDQLPFTDSDGLYDFPSSDCPPPNKHTQTNTANHRKSTRRRERRSSRTGSKTPSPTKCSATTLDLPGKERVAPVRKPSPKRRIRTQKPISSSSSTESLHSQEYRLRRDIGEDTMEDVANGTVCKTSSVPDDLQRPLRKTSRMRTIGHQIRFLRRIELSLKQRERLVSLSDSGGDDDYMDDDAAAAVTLLPKEMRKSVSISQLQQRPSRRRKKRVTNDLLLPGEDTRLVCGNTD